MKSILLSLTAFALLTFLTIQNKAIAQDTSATLEYSSSVYYPHNVIKINPLAAIIGQNPFTGELRLTYERAIGKSMASFIAVSYNVQAAFKIKRLLPDSLQNFTIKKVSGFRIQVGHKFYLTKFSIPVKGFYLAPHISYNTTKFDIQTDTMYNVTAVLFNVNILTGYQIITGGSFAFDIFTGLGYKSNTWEVYDAGRFLALKETKSGLKISFGFNFGYAF